MNIEQVAAEKTSATPPPVKRDGVNWRTVIAFGIFHCGAIAACFYFTWPAVLTSVFLYWIALSFGIGMGYHRLLTHRSYRTSKPVEHFLTICATLALEGGPIAWVATHRIHHQFSDHDGDPHTPRDGKLWAHIIWMLVGNVTHCDEAAAARYAPDLLRDPFMVWIDRYFWLPVAISGILLLALGGLPFLLWGLFFRVVAGHHATWLVNSATHFWGRRRFETRDDSRNTWWVALLTFGEGWHNNHHAHPTSARHGLAWYELDMTWVLIWVLRCTGLAKSVRVAGLPAQAEPRP